MNDTENGLKYTARGIENVLLSLETQEDILEEVNKLRIKYKARALESPPSMSGGKLKAEKLQFIVTMNC